MKKTIVKQVRHDIEGHCFYIPVVVGYVVGLSKRAKRGKQRLGKQGNAVTCVKANNYEKYPPTPIWVKQGISLKVYLENKARFEEMLQGKPKKTVIVPKLMDWASSLERIANGPSIFVHTADIVERMKEMVKSTPRAPYYSAGTAKPSVP